VGAEVELDLAADLHGVVALGQVLELVGARRAVLEAAAAGSSSSASSTATTPAAASVAVVAAVTVVAALALLVAAVEVQDLLAVGGGRDRCSESVTSSWK
jgi:hypothetical protein